MRLANTSQAGVRLLARLAQRAAQRRSPRRVLGSRPPRADRLALLELQLPADPRGGDQRPMAGARPGVRDPRRERRRVAAARRPEPAGARARAGALHRQRGDGHGPLPRRQPVRAICRTRRGHQGPLGLRAAVGGRRDLGQRRAPARAAASISTSTRASTPATGSRSPARCAATGRCRGSRRPRSPRPRRPAKPSSKSRVAAAAAAGAGGRLQHARPPTRPTPTAHAPIRIQFSRDMDGKTFSGRVKVSYVGPPPQRRAGGASRVRPSATSTAIARARDQVRRRRSTASGPVKVELLGGILSNVDNQPLAPCTLTFTTGG